MASSLPPCCSCDLSVKPIGDQIIKTRIVTPTASSFVSSNPNKSNRFLCSDYCCSHSSNLIKLSTNFHKQRINKPGIVFGGTFPIDKPIGKLDRSQFSVS